MRFRAGTGRLRPWSVLTRPWRRSLQLRVVATTTLLGMAVVALLGVLLYSRIRDGLVQDRLVVARSEATRGVRDAQARFDTVTEPDGLNLLVNDLLPRLASPEGDRSRDVVLLRALANDRTGVIPDFTTGEVSDTTIPMSLRTRVASSGRQEQQYVRVRYIGSERTKPGIAIGSMVSLPVAGTYELYFVFPLDREQATLDLVRRTFLGGGVALVLLLGAVAYLVTRQVVRPVRQAATVAQRLSSGRLQERMLVRGEDDLARLAASFNAMAASLQAQIVQLENLSRVQQRFVSDVSHELRTPLTTIRMAADVLHEARTDFDPAVARSAELLATQLDRFESLLTDLLEISRIDAGGELLDLEPVDLRDLAARVVEGALPLAGDQLELVVPEYPCIAQVDGRRIDRVLRNLVVNAIEHGNGRPIVVTVDAGCSDEVTAADSVPFTVIPLASTADEIGSVHGSTEVEPAPPGGSSRQFRAVAISVRDHGVGLRPGEAALVFNRFWRADPSRARTIGGSGLGLAISREDVRLHGGWLQAWGEPGQGSCFRMTLPTEPGVELTTSPLPLAPEQVTMKVGGPYLRLAASAPPRLGVPPGRTPDGSVR